MPPFLTAAVLTCIQTKAEVMTDAVSSATRATNRFDIYRAVWRWHFYAGLLVLPFLISLAVTGGLYLFRDEIDTFVHAELKSVVAQDTRTTPSAMIAAAVAAYPGTAVKFTDPATPRSSAEITVQTQTGERRAVYVNPYTGEVLGSLPDRGTIMWTIRRLHSLKSFGPVARGVIEIVGGWAILLVATGLYLWWPRGRGSIPSIRGVPRQRVFWRDLHAATGLLAGGVIVFLAMTGIPWSGVWGAQVNQWANGSNFGYPSGVRVNVPMSSEHLDHISPTTWSLEQARMPQSGEAASTPIGIDEAVAIVDGLGLHRGYALALPTTPTGVYSASVYPDDLSRQRVVHIDQYSGKPLIDMSYADYGPVGRALEWGINVHMGQQFGRINQFGLLAFCLLIIVLSVSAGAMWWKRRPRQALGVPPLPTKRSRIYGVAAILGLGGLLFPLTGASFLAILLADYLLTKGMRQAA